MLKASGLFILSFLIVLGSVQGNSARHSKFEQETERGSRPSSETNLRPLSTTPFSRTSPISTADSGKEDFERALKSFKDQKEPKDAGINFYKKESKQIESILYKECQVKTTDKDGNNPTYKQRKLWTAMINPGALQPLKGTSKVPGRKQQPGETGKSSFYFEMDSEVKDQYSTENFSALEDRLETTEVANNAQLQKVLLTSRDRFMQKLNERSTDLFSPSRWMVERENSLGYDLKTKDLEMHISFKRDPNLEDAKGLVIKMELHLKDAIQTVICMK